MANPVCSPSFPGSHSVAQGYEEIHVPAAKPKPFAENEQLVKIEDMPDFCRPAFAHFKTLNRYVCCLSLIHI